MKQEIIDCEIHGTRLLGKIRHNIYLCLWNRRKFTNEAEELGNALQLEMS